MSEPAAAGASGAPAGRQGNAGRRRGDRGGRRGGKGGRGGGRGGSRGGRRPRGPGEARLDDQMVDYWAKSDDPKLKERAENERKERAEALKAQRQKKLDEDMENYWKKQKVEGEAEATEAAPTETTS